MRAAVQITTQRGGHSDKRQAAGETEGIPGAGIQDPGDGSPHNHDEIGVEQLCSDNAMKQNV